MYSSKSVITVLIIVFSFVLLFGFRAAEQTGDALRYAVSIRTTEEMFHPHHLLFIPIVRQVYHLIPALSLASDPIFAAQIHNILWAIVAVVAFYLTIERLLGSRLLAIFSAMYLLVSFGFWEFSTQVETYVPATACLMLVFARLVIARGRGLKLMDIVWVVLFLSLAVFYHQTNVLFCIPLGCYLVLSAGRRGWKPLVIVTGFTGLIVLAVYSVVFISISESPTVASFVKFCLRYTYHPNPNWGNIENFSNGGFLIMSFTQLHNLVPFPYHLEKILGALFALMAAVLIVWSAVRVAARSPRFKIRAFLLVWLVVYYIFFLWWHPRNPEFFITPLIPLMALIVMLIDDVMSMKFLHRKGRTAVIAAMTLLLITMASVNAIFAGKKHRDKGEEYHLARSLAGLAPDDSKIYGSYAVIQNLRYYFDRHDVGDVDMPLTWVYNSMPVPEEWLIERDQKFIVPLIYVVPEYADSVSDGYAKPECWLEFINWLFEYRSNPAGDEKRWRAFRMVADADGKLYVAVSSTAGNSGDTEELVRRLDQEIRLYRADSPDTFGAWYKWRSSSQ